MNKVMLVQGMSKMKQIKLPNTLNIDDSRKYLNIRSIQFAEYYGLNGGHNGKNWRTRIFCSELRILIIIII